jgi:predicted metal-dependent HD superfamily phosphohydrolase
VPDADPSDPRRPDDELEERWLQALAAADATAPLEARRSAGADLLARWREPSRRYHDESHLRAVLDAVDLLRPEAGDPALVVLGAWFHDAVYEGRPGDDEERSALLATDVLERLGLPAASVGAVAGLVRMTADHRPAPGGGYDQSDGAVLADADLSVLAGSAAAYARYVAAVRAEYAAVPEPDFRAGRARVLRALASAPALFRTVRGRELWEEQARANLSAELGELAAGVEQPGS